MERMESKIDACISLVGAQAVQAYCATELFRLDKKRAVEARVRELEPILRRELEPKIRAELEQTIRAERAAAIAQHMQSNEVSAMLCVLQQQTCVGASPVAPRGGARGGGGGLFSAGVGGVVMEGVPLLGTLQRARKKYRESMEGVCGPAAPSKAELLLPQRSNRHLRVTIIERGEPNYECLLALFVQMMSNVDEAITELKAELRRMAGGVVDSDHVVLNIRDYREVYSLQPRVIEEQLKKKKRVRKSAESCDDESDTVSSE
jgi:hypothetical protein